METVQNTLVARESSGWRKSDTVWMLGLYGTAIGAGVLFLPINAGVGGLIPLIIMAILAFPMTFFAHRGLTRFVLSGKIREKILPKWWKNISAPVQVSLSRCFISSLFIRFCWFIALLLPTPSTALLLTSLVWCLRRALFCR